MANKPTVLEEAQNSGSYRPCLDCPKDISDLSPKALRCKSCAYEREKARARERGRINYQANRETVLQQVKKYQQSPKGKQKHQEWREKNPERLEVYRDRKRQAHREKTGYNPQGRTCRECGDQLPVERGHRAKLCDDCSKPLTRTCVVCYRPFKAKGTRTQHCSDECIIEDRRVKEQQGYTKTCNKCGVTKPYSEFRLHYGRRNAVCKRCEADATQAYLGALPPEVRKERRRIQGQREKEQRANLSLEEKVLLNDKERRAQLRREYGPDFDLDSFYAEQDGKCAICKRCALLKDLEVDHDHETHVKGTMHSVRGLLCKNCNLKLVPQYEKKFLVWDWPYMNEYLKRGKGQ